jgi:sulfur relay protein TusB/DsrH
VLSPDVEARGLLPMLHQRFKPISDKQFVELSIRCQQQQSWY